MKKLLLSTIFTALMLLAFVQTNYAQDNWVQGKKGIYTVGLGGTQVIGIYSGGGTNIANLGLSINASGEYKVWDFIGVGWQTGLNVMWPYGRYFGYSYYGYGTGGYVTVGIPLIAKCNVHILDAANVSIADKLDLYAGLGFGGGPAFGVGGGVGGFICVGPQVGVRYWFNDKVGIMGEFGWGATFANAGVTF